MWSNITFLVLNQNICCGAQKNLLNERVLLGTQNLRFNKRIRKYSYFNSQIFSLFIILSFWEGLSRPPDKSAWSNKTFLVLNQDICCGCSKEPSQWDGSFEHPKLMFERKDKKILAILHTHKNINLDQYYLLELDVILWILRIVMCLQGSCWKFIQSHDNNRVIWYYQTQKCARLPFICPQSLRSMSMSKDTLGVHRFWDRRSNQVSQWLVLFMVFHISLTPQILTCTTNYTFTRTQLLFHWYTTARAKYENIKNSKKLNILMKFYNLCRHSS